MARKKEQTAAGQAERAPGRVPGKVIVLFVLMPAAMIIAAGLTIYSQAQKRAAMTAVEVHRLAEGGRAAYYPLPDFLVDLSPDAQGRTAYLRMSAALLLDRARAAEAAPRIEAMEPLLRERASLFLRELRPEDFDGSEGMARVKAELLRRVNLALAPIKAEDVIIEDMVIQ
ncbi:MAG: flagellar basal body-associated protein FliL [Parvularculaceae bacterium]